MSPMIAAIRRAIQPAARSIRRWVNAPRRPSRLPKRSKNRLRIPRLEGQINPARVFIMKQYFLPAFSAVFRTENAPFRIWPVRMPQGRHKNFVGIARIYEDSSDLPRILQPDMLPRLAGVR